MAIERITKIGTKPRAGAKIKIVSGPKKDTNLIQLDADQNNVFDPNADGETRAVDKSTGYFGKTIEQLGE
jgi:hypothetical protein